MTEQEYEAEGSKDAVTPSFSVLHPSPAYSGSLWEEFADVDVADVVVDVEAPDLLPTYSYRVPEELRAALSVGICVHVPFHGREALGYVLGRRRVGLSDPLCGKLKDVIGVVEDAVTINAEQLHIVEWMRAQYVCDLLSAVRCVSPTILGSRVVAVCRLTDPTLRGRDVGESVPQAHLIETLRAVAGENGEAEVETLREAANLPGFSTAYATLVKRGLVAEARSVSRAKTVGKTVRAYELGAAADTLRPAKNRAPNQERILNVLVERARRGEGPVPQDELLREAQASQPSLKTLVDKGLVFASELRVHRTPVIDSGMRTAAPELTPGQRNAVDALHTCVQSGEHRAVLLFGVTASGKTEVYLNVIAHTLATGRSAIVLLPEIALTAQVVDVFVGRFGAQVAVLHSKLSEGERHDEWRRMQRGEARIVVGARSAVFAPLENVGLIVVDEEHEASYKQENNPRYNAREVARERARIANATLVLGSATPSLESYYASEEDIRYRVVGAGVKTSSPTPEPQHPIFSTVLRVEMPERIDNRPLPSVEVIDLREEFKSRRALFSSRLEQAMGERLSRKEQTILFLNRRGYAQFVLCRDCGWAAKCPNCAVSLAFHAYDRSLKCHHCDHTGRAPQTCPDCGGPKVKAFGIGTEKIEEEVLRVFPSARVARMDRDTTAKKGAHTQIVRDFRRGEADILIGTQMVAKGLDFPNVTLVGVVSADTAINMPDFRAAERTFQLLTQVAGRAGRGTRPGEVIVQTFSPDHYAVQSAIRHDYRAFYNQEILFRKELNYPPFSRFANLICADSIESKAQARATRMAAALERILPKEVEVIGPAPAPLARLKAQFRYHLALRAPVDAPLSKWVARAVERLETADRLGLVVDMDPLSMA